jgi:hypothetical protein
MKPVLVSSFGAYAKQRLFRILCDFLDKHQDQNWSALAEEIYLHRGVKFQRNNFYRLKDGKLKDANIEIIVAWFEAVHDPDIRERLKPQAIFDEVGKSSRDYYFHIPDENFVDEWDEQILADFAGVYLCQPASDKNSFLPLPTLRAWYADRKAMPQFDNKMRSLDIKQYIQERSLLILQRTTAGYFYAAEFPLSLLFPDAFETLDIRMVYEGIGVVSSNAIQVQLRECLSRVPKTHAILISPKNQNQNRNPFGLSLFLPIGTEGVREDWKTLSQAEIEHLRAEFAHSIEAEHYLSGPAQITESPIPNLRSRVGMSFSRDLIYARKPADLLRKKELHFIRPDLDNEDEIEKIIANPLSIGELL